MSIVEFNFLDFISTNMDEPMAINMVNEMIKELGMGVLLNLLLVHRNIRPAMLFQPIDYGEDNRNFFNISGSILKKVQTFFPDLILSYFYENFQGIIIGKQSFDNRTDISSEEMGKILGYPCYEGFLDLHNNITAKEYYGVDVMAELENGEMFQLYGCLCQNYSLFQPQFEAFAQQASEVFQTYYKILKVKKILIDPTKISSVQSIVKKLITGAEELDEADNYKIINIFYNCDFHILNKEFHFLYQKDNPIHKGLLIGFLLNEQNNLISPFYPMSPSSEEYKKVQEISAKWEADLIKALTQTKDIMQTMYKDYYVSGFIDGSESKP